MSGKGKFKSIEEEPLLPTGSDDRQIQSQQQRKHQFLKGNKSQPSAQMSPGQAAIHSPSSKLTDIRSRPAKQPNRTTKTSQKLVVFPESFQPETQVTDVASEYGDSDDRVVSYSFQMAKEKEAERLKKMDRKVLPRATAYCTAKSFHMDALYAFLLSKGDSNGCDPKRIDECIYTKYIPPVSILQFLPSPIKQQRSRQQLVTPPIVAPDRMRRSPSPSQSPLVSDNTPIIGSASSSSMAIPLRINAKSMRKQGDVESGGGYMGFATPPTASPWKSEEKTLQENDDAGKFRSGGDDIGGTPNILGKIDEHPGAPSDSPAKNTISTPQGELFLFDYGVVVMWGMTEPQEHYILSILKPFEEEKLDPDDIETEAFHYQYRPLTQPRIFNDVITLRAPVSSNPQLSGNPEDESLQKQDSMIKLTISHAIAQSTKLTLYEQRIDDTILNTQHIPLVMAKTGKVPMSRSAITKKIGQLFVMRINVNLVSPILDTPEIFWSEPSLEPLYSAVRGYLEISQRVELLNQRCNVISDLLDMLKEHLNSAHGETLEWIIIVLIAIEILIGLVEIFFDFFNFYRAPHQG